MCTCTTALCAYWCAEQPEELLGAQPGRAPVNPVLAVVE